MRNIWKGIIITILILCLIGAALYVYSYYIYIKRPMDVTLDGTVFLEDGSSQPCTVGFQGTYVLNSPSSGDQFNGGYDGGIFINDTRVLPGYPFWETDEILILGAEMGYFYLDKDMSIFVAKVDAASILEDTESQDAYVVLNQNLPAEYEPVIQAIQERETQDRESSE